MRSGCATLPSISLHCFKKFTKTLRFFYRNHDFHWKYRRKCAFWQLTSIGIKGADIRSRSGTIEGQCSGKVASGGAAEMSSRGEQPQKLVFCMGGVDFRSTICQFYEAFLRVRVLEHRFCEAFLLHCSTTHQFCDAFLKVWVLDVQPFHRFRYIVSINSWNA